MLQNNTQVNHQLIGIGNYCAKSHTTKSYWEMSWNIIARKFDCWGTIKMTQYWLNNIQGASKFNETFMS